MRLDLLPPGGRLLGKRDGPRQHLADITVATAVEEAADPPQGDPERQRGCNDVDHWFERERAQRAVEKERGRPAQHAAVEYDAPLPDLEHIPDVIDAVAPVLPDIEHASSDQPADEDPERQVVNELRVEFLTLCAPGSEVH